MPDEDSGRYEQAGEIFDPPMTEGMLGVWFLSAILKPIRVIKRRAGVWTGCLPASAVMAMDPLRIPAMNFPYKKQSIQPDPHRAAEHAVGLPDLRRTSILYNPL